MKKTKRRYFQIKIDMAYAFLVVLGLAVIDLTLYSQPFTKLTVGLAAIGMVIWTIIAAPLSNKIHIEELGIVLNRIWETVKDMYTPIKRGD